MRRYIVRNHRNRAKLTLTRKHSAKLDVSVTLALTGKRVLEISDKLADKYADALTEYVKSGALIALPSTPDAPAAPAAPAPGSKLAADEVDVDVTDDVEDDSEHE